MENSMLEQYLRSVLTSTSPDAVVKAYLGAFRECSPIYGGEWIKFPNHGAASQFAWNIAESLTNSDANASRYDISPWRLWFLGFLNGRLPVRIPDWWEELLLKHKWRDGKWTSLCAADLPIRQRSKSGIWTLIGVEAAATSEGVTITKGGRNIFVRSELVDGRSTFHMVDFVDVAFDGDSGYVVVVCFGTLAERRATVIRIRLADWEPIWVRHVLRYQRVDVGGLFVHVLQPMIGRDGCIYVFGCESFRSYFDAFAAKTGDCVGRFGTEIYDEINFRLGAEDKP